MSKSLCGFCIGFVKLCITYCRRVEKSSSPNKTIMHKSIYAFWCQESEGSQKCCSAVDGRICAGGSWISKLSFKVGNFLSLSFSVKARHEPPTITEGINMLRTTVNVDKPVRLMMTSKTASPIILCVTVNMAPVYRTKGKSVWRRVETQLETEKTFWENCQCPGVLTALVEQIYGQTNVRGGSLVGILR